MRTLLKFLRLYLPLTILLLAGAGFYANQAIERELAQIRNQESAYIKLGARALSNKIEFIYHDLTFLTKHSALRNAIEHTTPFTIAHAAEDVSIFSESRGHYDQIRWIDQYGMEMLRVDYLQGKSITIPASKLQDKGQRYYFTDTLKLRPGEVFVSPLDLNIEQEKIEVPFKPMLRVATPVSDQQGNNRGIIVINYFGKDLLEAFSSETANITNHSMILNDEGYWLKSPNPKDEWGFMFKRPELNMKTRSPLAWNHIRNTEAGQLELVDGLWTWETVYPLQINQKSSVNSVDTFSSILGEVASKQYFWKSVAHFPADSLNAVRYEILLKTAWVVGLLLLLMGIGCWLLVRAWEALENEKLKFRTLSDFAYDWETWLDQDGQYIYCSPSCVRVTGRRADEFFSDQNLLTNIAYPDDLAVLKSHLQRHQASDAPCEFQFRIVTPDGHIKWLEHACQSVFSESGQFLGRRGSNRDITERKRAEMALSQSQADLREAQRVARVGSWQLDLATNHIVWSEELYRMQGLDPESTTPPDYTESAKLFTPDSWERLNHSIAQAAEFGICYELELEMVKPDGSHGWMLARGEAVRDLDNLIVGVRGVAANITERKRSELALHESHQKMRSLLNSMAEGAYGVDTNGICTFVNRSFLRILGYELADEVIGKNIHMLIHHKYPDGSPYPQSECKMYNAYRHIEEIHVTDEVFWRKDESAIPVEYWSQPIIVDGVVTGAIATFVDITQRKLAEEQIHNLAFYDALTNLPNRRLLNDRLGHTMAASKRSGRYCALMFLDLDNFKPLNDAHGHAIGDLLLVEVARRIGGCVREVDTVARFGGDEFVVILSELDTNKNESASQASIVADKIRAAVAEPYLLAISKADHAGITVEHHCTSSIGVVIFINHEATSDDILKLADAAMYQAKESGRNQICFNVAHS